MDARHDENGVEIFVFAGEFSDELGDHREGTWVRLPVGASHRPSTHDGYQIYVKYGGVAKLRA